LSIDPSLRLGLKAQGNMFSLHVLAGIKHAFIHFSPHIFEKPPGLCPAVQDVAVRAAIKL
jgi:hypothetical protein